MRSAGRGALCTDPQGTRRRGRKRRTCYQGKRRGYKGTRRLMLGCCRRHGCGAASARRCDRALRRTSPWHPLSPLPMHSAPGFVEVGCWRRAWLCTRRLGGGIARGNRTRGNFKGTLGPWHCPWVPCSAGPPCSRAPWSPTPQPTDSQHCWPVDWGSDQPSSSRLEQQGNTSGCRVQGCSLRCLQTDVIRAMVMTFNSVQNSCFTTNAAVGKRGLLHFPASGIS